MPYCSVLKVPKGNVNCRRWPGLPICMVDRGGCMQNTTIYNTQVALLGKLKYTRDNWQETNNERHYLVFFWQISTLLIECFKLVSFQVCWFVFIGVCFVQTYSQSTSLKMRRWKILFCVKSPDACTGTRQQANANDDSLVVLLTKFFSFLFICDAIFRMSK